jgi:nucleotidyltransferase substrate binding protein (TIGR01987 family)
MISVARAIVKLKLALEQNSTDELVIDGTIQRFEFCIELFWKMLKRALQEEGIETGTPREAIQRAYQVKWFDDERLWLQMLHDRNQTSHIYDEEVAKEIYQPKFRFRVRHLLPRLIPCFFSVTTTFVPQFGDFAAGDL